MPGRRSAEGGDPKGLPRRRQPPVFGWAAKKRQIVSVAFTAVAGGSVPAIFCIAGCGEAPGHWCPAPSTVISSTVRLSGQSATDVVTGPAVVTVGVAHLSTLRHMARTSGTG